LDGASVGNINSFTEREKSASIVGLRGK